MKRLLSLLLVLMMMLSINSYTVLGAQYTPEGVALLEDFNDYEGTGEPSGWSWVNIGAAVSYKVSPCKFDDYGIDTAMKISTESTGNVYLGGSTQTVSITDGVLRTSFQVNFDRVGVESNSQILSVHGGTKDSPLSKGFRIVNGTIQYHSGTETSKYSNTTTHLYANKWYTLDVVSDYDKGIVTYYIDGEPLIDEATEKPVETTLFKKFNSKTMSSIIVAARTKHAKASAGGDINVDNIKLTDNIASGVYGENGSELSENPSKLDIRFNNTVNTKEFSIDDVTVNVYKATDYSLANPTPVNFTVSEITAIGCELTFDNTVELADYDKIVVDFGENLDFLDGKLSSTTFVKMPAPADLTPVTIFDSESSDPTDIEIVADEKVTASDYAYKSGTEDKTAKLYVSDGGTVEIGYKDGTTNLFKEGYSYNLSFKMKALDTLNTKDTSQYNIVGRTYNGEQYLAVRLAVFLRNLNTNNPRTYDMDQSGSVKIATVHKWNTDKTLIDTTSYTEAQIIDNLFNNQKWMEANFTYYPDIKRFNVKFTSEDGLVGELKDIDSYFANDSSLAKDATTAHDGTLKTIQFRMPAKDGKIVLDEVKITETKLPETSAAIKYMLLKDEKGSVIQNDGTSFAPGAKTIELYFDGDIDQSAVNNITFSGLNAPAYSTEYNSADKVFKIKLEKLLVGDSDFSIGLPTELNLKGNVGAIDFTTSAGNVDITDFAINSTNTASVYVKNTTLDINDPATLIIASYNDGVVVDIKVAPISVASGSYGTVETEAVTTTGADTIKAYVVDSGNLTHLIDGVVKEISTPSEKTYERNYSGEAIGETVTAILMNPRTDDRSQSYTLANLSENGTASYIDVIALEDGEYNFGFDISGISGYYTLYVMDETGVEIYKDKFLYSTDEDRKAAQVLVNDAVANNDTSDALLQVLNDYSIELCLTEIDLYADIDKAYVAEKLYQSVKENSINVDVLDDTLKRVGDICIIDALNNDKTDDIGAYSSMAAMFDREPVKTWYDEGIADSAKITTRLLGLDETITDGTMDDVLMEALALEIIDEGTGFETVKALCKLLEDEIGIKASKGTTSVYRKLDGDYFKDYADLAKTFKELTKGSGGGGGGGLGGNEVDNGKLGITTVPDTATSIEQKPTVAPAPLKEYVFTDIADYGWAIESITTLYEKNIIAGKGDSKFAPGDRVMREEFVKMIVEAFGIEGTSDVQFNDVSDNSWAKPYIVKAYGAGIINGQGSAFGIGQSITRQDMAKIIYETATKAGYNLVGKDISTLDDYNRIASYATDAVAALYNNGIINGKSKNAFAPVDYATRAEAAVIISRAMALIK